MIRLSKSCIGDEEKLAVQRVLDSEFLGMGANVGAFERELSVYFGRPVVCVSTGTAALQLAVQACGIGAGDEVLVPTITYVASFQAVSATGAKPIACGVDGKTLTLDPKDLKARLTSRTKAIMPVHYAGGVGQLAEIYEFARLHKLRVIEDAAHSFGSYFDGKRVGSFGDISCFSFDGIKNITSGEGGCIVTDDESVIESVSDSRLLGVQKDSAKRYLGQRSWSFNVVQQGWRYHMSDLMAAIGREQLKKSGQQINKRQTLAKAYTERLSHLGAWLSPLPLNYDDVAPHIFPVVIIDCVSRDALASKLADKNIQTGVHYFPNHCLDFFQSQVDSALKEAESISNRVLTLPLHPDLDITDLDYICGVLESALESLLPK